MELPAASGTVRLLLSFAAITLISIPAAACGGDEAPAAGPATPSPDGTSVSLSTAMSRDARRTAARVLDAFVDWDTSRVWEMLLPEVQARWTGEQAFSGFLERKFGEQRLDYELGEPRPLADSGDSITVPVTIDFEDSGDRFAGPPLVLVRHEDSLAIADAGPLGPRGPIVGPPPPLRSEIDVPILIYHHLLPQLAADYKQALDTVTTAAFADQLSWLRDNGYTSITVAELFNAFYYDLPLPSRPVILVFDDGYADAYEYAFPLLLEQGFGATVAAITGAMGQAGYLTWKQAQEMSASGVEFVSHTVTHANLAALTRDQMLAELSDSRRALEETLGRPAQFFVYPYGEPFTSGSAESQQMVLALLGETGYVGALTTSSAPPYVSIQRANAPYQLRRIPVSGGESLARFAASITAES